MIADAPVRHYRTVDSTNLEAQRLAAAGERGPLWLVADEQTAGRGRLGRSWASEPGNLYATLILPLERDVSAVPQLGFVVALAVHDMAAAFAATHQVVLKWPNDCLVDGAKLSGILCEVVNASPLAVALGCGINVAHAPEGLPYPATALARLQPDVDVRQVFESYRKALGNRLVQWQQGFAGIATAWAERAIGIGEVVEVRQGETVTGGRFTGIAVDGAMILQGAGGSHMIRAGDVTIPSLATQRRALA